MAERLRSRARIAVPLERIADFSRRWGIAELALFGSVLRDDFHMDSDVDVLVTFARGAKQSLGSWLEMQDELKSILGRNVDLIDRDSIERSVNWYRRLIILESAEVLYAA